MGGLVNVDEIVFPTKVFSGMTVRIFNRSNRQWSLYWISSTGASLYPPVFGGFSGERGEFYGDDAHGGRGVKVRYIWTKSNLDAPRWEQAFFFDGREWETNWVMDFKPVSESVR